MGYSIPLLEFWERNWMINSNGYMQQKTDLQIHYSWTNQHYTQIQNSNQWLVKEIFIFHLHYNRFGF